MEINISFGRRGGRSFRAMSPGTSWFVRVLSALVDNRLTPELMEKYAVKKPVGMQLDAYALLKGEVGKKLLAAFDGDKLALTNAIGYGSWGDNLDAALDDLLKPIYASLRYQQNALNIRHGWQVSFWTRTFSRKAKAAADPHLAEAQINLRWLERALKGKAQPVRYTHLLPAPQFN